MAKTPVLLTAAEWKKAKPVTLTDPGLEKSLKAWEAAKRDAAAVPTLAKIKKSADALADVVDMAKVTAGKANKTLHKDAITFLAGYQTAAIPLSKQMQKDGADLHRKIEAWCKVRLDTLAALKALKPEAEKLGKRAGAVLKKHKDTDPANAAEVKVVKDAANKVFDELGAFRKKAAGTVDAIRIAGKRDGALHADDQPAQFIKVFTDTSAMTRELEGLTFSPQEQLGAIIGKQAPHFQPSA